MDEKDSDCTIAGDGLWYINLFTEIGCALLKRFRSFTCLSFPWRDNVYSCFAMEEFSLSDLETSLVY